MGENVGVLSIPGVSGRENPDNSGGLPSPIASSGSKC